MTWTFWNDYEVCRMNLYDFYEGSDKNKWAGQTSNTIFHWVVYILVRNWP